MLPKTKLFSLALRYKKSLQNKLVNTLTRCSDNFTMAVLFLGDALFLFTGVSCRPTSAVVLVSDETVWTVGCIVGVASLFSILCLQYPSLYFKSDLKSEFKKCAEHTQEYLVGPGHLGFLNLMNLLHNFNLLGSFKGKACMLIPLRVRAVFLHPPTAQILIMKMAIRSTITTACTG